MANDNVQAAAHGTLPVAERLASCNHPGPHGYVDEHAWCPRCGAVRLKVATTGDPWLRPGLVCALARVLALAQPQPLPDLPVRPAEDAREVALRWRASRARWLAKG